MNAKGPGERRPARYTLMFSYSAFTAFCQAFL